MDPNDSVREAERILHDAGWQIASGWHGYTHGSCVGGVSPDGTVYVKNIDAIKPGDPRYGPDTPDEHHEAAAWLVQHAKDRAAPVEPYDQEVAAIDHQVDALFGVAPVSEEGESLQDESNGETGEETQAAEREGPGSTSKLLDAGCDGAAFSELEPIDADFTIEDLGGPDETLELPAPDPEDFAPEDFAHDPEPEAPQDRFIGLDDLDRVRSLRIGDVATEALRLTTMIEQAVSEQEGEFSNIQAYVVSNLDKHTGAFTPQDDASRATYGRFLELSSARSKIALIDARRKDATALLIAAGRDEVVSFDVQAAFA